MKYEDILSTFGWNSADDLASAQSLRPGVGNAWNLLGTDFKNRVEATVIGCGPQLETLTAQDLPRAPVVAADGATEWCMEQNVLPRAVVTDLDGNPEALHWAAMQGASMIVHAHGHNQDKFAITEDWPVVLGTYQAREPDASLAPMRHSDGFTDGDRAVLLMAEHLVKRIHLYGFDFDAQPSKYSHAWSDTKPQKLAIARDIIASIRGPELVWATT